MWNWLVRQYADIRGNLKWAILVGLYWVIATYGRRLLQLIPNIPEWLVYGVIMLVSLMMFVWVAKRTSKPSAPTSQTTNKLKILRAVYGIGQGRDIDITDKLKAMAPEGLVIPVDNNLVSFDPAIGVRKRLVVDYSYGDGTVLSAYAPESIPGETMRVVLPEDPQLRQLQQKVAQLSQSLLTRKSQIEDDIPLPSDPIIRVEVFSEKVRHLQRETRFLLHNESTQTAYRIKMQDIDLSSDKIGKAVASFNVVEAIPGKQSRTIVPKIASHAALFYENFIPYMEGKIEAAPEALAEISLSAKIMYEDYTGKQKFETTFDVAFIPRRDVTEEQKLKWAEQRINLPLEIRNQRFKKLTNK